MKATFKLSTKEAVSSFLYFGYIPQVPSNLGNKIWTLKHLTRTSLFSASVPDKTLIKKGVHIFKSIFENVADGQHIVPLSGGMDSRAILGGLIDAGLKEQVTTVTFGTPGTFDYDIGNLVAKRMKINHKSIDLNQIKLNTELLVEMVRKEQLCGWVFDFFYMHLIPKMFCKDAVYWSGLMGDALSGVHQMSKDSATWGEALLKFTERYRYVKSVDLSAPGFDPVSVLPQRPFWKDSILSYDEQLAIQRELYYHNVVTVEGYRYHLPFLHPDWLKFILNVPRKYREHQYLYKEILKKAYPRLFFLPTKTNYGLPLNAPVWKSRLYRLSQAVGRRVFAGRAGYIDPQMRYIDFDRGLRKREDLKKVVYENLQDLKKRNIIDWVDIDDLYNRHQLRKGNYADALTLLASLEIIIKAQQSNIR